MMMMVRGGSVHLVGEKADENDRAERADDIGDDIDHGFAPARPLFSDRGLRFVQIKARCAAARNGGYRA